MRNVFLLLKLQLDNSSDVLKTMKPKTIVPAIFKTIALLLLATFAVSTAIFLLRKPGFLVNREVLTLVLLGTQVVSVVFAIGNIINTLYMSPDNQLLFCLPVTPNQLFISKLLKIYIKEVKVNAMMSIPLFVALGTYNKEDFGLTYYISVMFLLLILPIFPIVLGALISIPAMMIIKFLKKHPALSVIVVFASLAAILGVYIFALTKALPYLSVFSDIAGEKRDQTVRQINDFVKAAGSSIPFYYQLAGAMLNFKALWFIYPIFIVSCAILTTITIAYTRRFFFKAAMSSLEKTIKKRRERLSNKFQKRGKVHSLFLKEFRCVFRSPSDIFEYFLFTILMPFIVISCDSLLISVAENIGGTNMRPGAHFMVLAILAMLSNISSASAISRDGNIFYMSKIIPVNYYTQMFAKFLFNATFTAGALTITAIASLFVLPLWQVILGTLAVIFLAVGHIAYSIDSDIKSPTVSNEGDGQSSTVSKCTPKSLLYGLLIGFILGLFLMMTASMEVAVLPYLIAVVASLVFMIYRVNNLVLRINLRYNKIEM